MIPRNPAGAVLWECWRLSRRSLLILIGIATLLGGALLLGFDGSPVAEVFTLLVLVTVGLWARVWSDSVDNRTGFTLVLGFTRPIHTWMLVVLPMAYIALATALTYLLPAAALRLAFDVPFPLFPVAVGLATVNLWFRASQWWSAERMIRIIGRFAIGVPLAVWFLIEQSDDGFMAPERWSEISGLSTGAYARMGLIALAAIALTVVGVARQRRGDDVLPHRGSPRGRGRTAERASFTERLVGVLRRPCPTSSPLRAQLWFETHALAVPVLLSGAGGAAAIAFLVALMTAVGSSQSAQASLAGLAIWAAFAPLVVTARRVLGLRRKQGNVYLGAFDGTRPIGSGRLIALRVAVAATSLVAAWAVIAAGAWVSLGAASMGGGLFSAVDQTFRGTPFTDVTGRAVLSAIQLAGVLACWAALNAWIVVRRQVVTAGAVGLVVCATALVYANYRGWLESWSIVASFWGLALVIAFASLHVLRLDLRERILAPRPVGILLLTWLGFAVLHMTVLPGIDVLNPGDAGMATALALLSVVIPLGGAALAPWSFSRLRHR